MIGPSLWLLNPWLDVVQADVSLKVLCAINAT
jgi:hypothetical protein